MNSKFDEGPKEEVRQRINIADLVGRYVKLKPSGQNFKGLCPFHKEKTPSFIVTPARGTFHCFGCNKGGDIFTFLQEIESLEFKDALSQLAEEAGVTLAHSAAADAPNDRSSETEESTISKPAMLAIHEKAARFFYSQIKDSAVAVDYFKGRGLKAETVREFLLGYAPPGWNNLIDHLKKDGIAPDALVSCGLALRKTPESAPYDRFRDRVIFTLFDTAGKPIGFAARTLKGDEQPKYLNSPETLIYKKSQTLYGLHKARQAIKTENCVLVVEGYMDYLTLFQAGICNVVATSGTAMTQDHGHVIRRFTSRVFLVFDGDGAGITAARRGVQVLAPFNFDVRVLILPDEYDPDEFIKEKGSELFGNLLKNAQPGFSFLLDKCIQERGIGTPQEKSAVVDDVLPYLREVSDSIVRLDYVRQCAEKLALPETMLNSKLSIRPRFRTMETGTPVEKPVRIGPMSLYSGTLEENFLRILLAKPDLVPEARQFIRPDTLTDSINSKLYSKIIEGYEANSTLTAFQERLDDSALKEKAAELIARQGPAENLSEDLADLMVHLQRAFLKRKQREVTLELKRDPANREALLAMQKEIVRQLIELDKS
jgi:DNA primase